ncbi:MAG: DUF4097 family beta strand repeat-containing protein [Eubacteriales bacterium]|nr:DUF4097 family beta strand repeat-containing protein [Eubacteriales bacterium]
MKRTGKIYAAAFLCIGLGIALTGGGILAGGWPGIAVGKDGIRMADEFYKEAYRIEKTELEEFSSADIKIHSGNFYILPSDGFYLEYCLSGTDAEPSYTVADKKLTFKQTGDLEFYIMNFTWGRDEEEYYVKLYVPEDIYLDTLQLNGDSGNAFLDKLLADNVDIELSCGNLEAGQMQAEEVKLSLKSGNVSFESLLANKAMDIQMDFGNLTGEELSAEMFTVDSGYGNLRLTRANVDSAELFLNSGNLTCEQLSAEKELSISLESGELKAEKASAQRLEIDSNYGNVTLGELEAQEAEISADSGNVKAQSCSSTSLAVTAQSGEVNIQESVFSDGSFSLSSGNLKLLQLSAQSLNISSNYGNVYLELSDEPSEYSMKLRTQYGSIQAPAAGSLLSDGSEENFSVQGSSEKNIEVFCESGDISIKQKKSST